MPFTSHAIKTFISAKITAVTECRLADLSAEFPDAGGWVSGLGLMIIFTDQPRPDIRAFVLQLIRRTEMALKEYSRAREELQSLLSKKGQWSPYYRALHHIETAVALLYQAYDSSRKALGQRLFEDGDGSPLQRLNSIYNTSKHQLASGEDTVWLSNDGIETAQAKLEFREFEELARACARIAQQVTRTK